MRHIPAALLAIFAVNLTVVGAKAQSGDASARASVADEQQSAVDLPSYNRRIEVARPSTSAEPAPPSSAPQVKAERRLPNEASSERTREVWYGWENFLADAASISLLGASTAVNAPGLAYAGLVGYVAGSPVIHAANGSSRKTAASAVLRLSLPFVGGVIAYALPKSNKEDDVEPVLAIAAGVTGGAIVAMIIDDFLIARKTVPSPGHFQVQSSSLRLVPLVSKEVKGLSLSLVL
jgi:hypothetical protein